MRPPSLTAICFGYAVTVSALGCADSVRPAGDGLSHEVDTVGSAERVRSIGTPPTWTIEEIFAVGSAGTGTAPNPDEFGRIVSIAVDTDGALLVADASNGSIAVFAPDGTFLRRFGRTGQGPGEFARMTSIALMQGRLLVLDFGNGRVAEVTLDGEWLGSRQAPGGVSGPASMLRFYPSGADEVHQWSITSTDGQLRRIWRVHDGGGVVGEWPQLDLSTPQPQSLRCPRPDDAITFIEVPYGGRLLQHPVAVGYTYIAWSADPSIVLIGNAGDTVRIIERPRRPAPISDEEWREATAAFEAFRDEWPSVVCEPRRIDRPTGKPIFRYLMVDATSRLWVEAQTPEGSTWEVFDHSGRLVAALDGFDYTENVPLSMNGDYIAWVSLGEMDVPRVHVGRINTGH